jgi:hypothetical protein
MSPQNGCPFCKRFDVELVKADHTNLYWWRCRKCGAEGPYDASIEKATELWDLQYPIQKRGEQVSVYVTKEPVPNTEGQWRVEGKRYDGLVIFSFCTRQIKDWKILARLYVSGVEMVFEEPQLKGE